jgi:hypothetical protein
MNAVLGIGVLKYLTIDLARLHFIRPTNSIYLLEGSYFFDR